MWKRPKDFIGEEFSIFDDCIDPCDIIQGTLGNCYFLSGLSAMAEYPERIKKLFVSPDTNTYGCYGAKFCINGEFQEILIDDLFPCFPEASSPTGLKMAFSQSRGGKEFWV